MHPFYQLVLPTISIFSFDFLVTEREKGKYVLLSCWRNYIISDPSLLIIKLSGAHGPLH